MPERIVLHVDMDAFYAAVEQRDHPELRGKPVIVGGTPQGRGVVATASYEARVFGVRSAMPAATAVRLCPQGVFLRPDFRSYQDASGQVMAILARYSDLIEQVSIDEAFLDLAGHAADFAEARQIALRIKRDIASDVGLTASVGVGPNKFLAKLGSDHQKPNGLVVVTPDQAEEFLAPLPVGRLWGVGPKTAKRLEGIGLRTIGQLAATPVDQLRRLLGAWADVALELAHGIDDRPLETHREAKSCSAEETFPRDLRDVEQMRRALGQLSADVARRLKGEKATARTIAIKVRFGDFHTITRQRRLTEPTDRADIIRRATRLLLDDVDRGARGIRLLGVRATGLGRGQQQLSLLDEHHLRRGKLERTLSFLRQRYGEGAVRWARDTIEQ